MKLDKAEITAVTEAVFEEVTKNDKTPTKQELKLCEDFIKKYKSITKKFEELRNEQSELVSNISKDLNFKVVSTSTIEEIYKYKPSKVSKEKIRNKVILSNLTNTGEVKDLINNLIKEFSK